MTAQRQRVAQRRTRTINQIKNVLRRYNLIWDCPTKGIQTLTALRWLGELRDDTHSPLNEVDRLNLSHLLEQWEMWSRELGQLEALIAQRALRDERVKLLRTVPGISEYSGLALACRVSSVERFPHPRSLANYFGLTPGCRNSGEATDRLGSITKEGSRIARFILAQVVLHVLKRDSAMRGWYARIKHRRGSKIARVAVMRRLATIVWHLLKHQEAYQVGGIRRRHPRKAAVEESASRSKKALLGTRQKGGRPVPSSPSIRPEG